MTQGKHVTLAASMLNKGGMWPASRECDMLDVGGLGCGAPEGAALLEGQPPLGACSFASCCTQVRLCQTLLFFKINWKSTFVCKIS